MAGESAEILKLIQKIQGDIHDLKEGSTRVLFYLEDDSTTGRKGLYSRVEETDQRVKSLEDYVAAEKINKRWINVIVGAVGGVLAMVAKYLISIIF